MTRCCPFFDSHNLPLLRVLTDRGTEYCGVRENHPYQLFLYLKDIEHSRTKARHPQTNGSTERFNQPLLDEFYQVNFRKKVYTSLEEIQADLDQFLHGYNTQEPIRGNAAKVVPLWKHLQRDLTFAGNIFIMERR